MVVSISWDQSGIGTTTPDPSAILDVNSTNKGFLLPRMTSAQRNAIISPATGLIVYDTNVDCVHSFYSAQWVNLCDRIEITTQPVAPASVCLNTGTQTISVTAQGTGLTYQWYRNNFPTNNVPNISGATTSTLTITNPPWVGENSWFVRITNSDGQSVTSNTVIGHISDAFQGSVPQIVLRNQGASNEIVFITSPNNGLLRLPSASWARAATIQIYAYSSNVGRSVTVIVDYSATSCRGAFNQSYNLNW